MTKKLYRWFRRVHDVLAIMLCCLWVAGWFVEISFSSVEGPTKADASVFQCYANAGELYALKMGQPISRLCPTGLEIGTDVGVRRVTDVGRLVESNLSIWRKIFTNSPSTPWKEFPRMTGPPAIQFSMPSILIVLPFLIWPLGRLTHRIVNRPEKIPNPAC